jgi:hypothetical protein
VRVAGLLNACAAGAGLRNPLAHAVGADVVDGALVAVLARVALVDVLLSAFACSAVIIIRVFIIISCCCQYSSMLSTAEQSQCRLEGSCKGVASRLQKG